MDPKKNKTEKRSGSVPLAAVILMVLVPLVGAILIFSLFLHMPQGEGRMLALSDSVAIPVIICLLVMVSLLAVFFFLISSRTAKTDTGTEKIYDDRFSKLLDTDSEMKKHRPAEYDRVSLGEICTGFCNYAASEEGLYYLPETVRAFVAGMSVSRLLIFQGISGTGKTSLAYAFGKYIQNDTVMVPVQPSWKDKTDLLGYYNEFTGSYSETELLSKLYEAEYNDEIYIALLDEMNIARVEYYFAEFLSVLELPDSESRTVEIVSDSRAGDPKKLCRGRLHISDNVWFVGTANNDDSTLAISDKVYDRATVIDLDRRAEPFSAPKTKRIKLSGSGLRELFAEARRKYRLGDEIREKIIRLDGYLTEEFGITFGNRIMRQLEGFVPVYIACGGSESEAVDQIISRKILRKLENRNPVYVRSGAEKLVGEINRLFGENALTLCSDYIGKIINQY